MVERTGYQRRAKQRWPHAEWVEGSGPFATLAHCRVLTVQLHRTRREAEAAKALIDECGCGGLCYNAHEILRLEQNETTE